MNKLQQSLIREVIKTAIGNGWKVTINVSTSGNGSSEAISADVKNKVHMDLLVETFINEPLMFLDLYFARAYWNTELN